jgi:hypothetical protein
MAMGEHLELPPPLQLIRTAGWSLTESVGLPVAAFALGAWLGGREIGLIAGLAAIWLTIAIRRLATGSITGLLMISAVVLTLQTVIALATGNLWIFLLHFPLANLCLCFLFARTARGPNPLCARLAAEMIALRQPVGSRSAAGTACTASFSGPPCSGRVSSWPWPPASGRCWPSSPSPCS